MTHPTLPPPSAPTASKPTRVLLGLYLLLGTMAKCFGMTEMF